MGGRGRRRRKKKETESTDSPPPPSLPPFSLDEPHGSGGAGVALVGPAEDWEGREASAEGVGQARREEKVLEWRRREERGEGGREGTEGKAKQQEQEEK